mgnify:FL=1
MLKAKITRKKNGKIDKLLKSLNTLNSNNLQVGHFAISGKHPSDPDLTYPQLLELWAHGAIQEGVIKNPLAAFKHNQIKNKGFLKNPKVKAVYRKWSKSLTTGRASEAFLIELGTVLRDEYANTFGKSGYLMPIVGNNKTPLVDKGDLQGATAFKSSINNNVDEVGKR